MKNWRVLHGGVLRSVGRRALGWIVAVGRFPFRHPLFFVMGILFFAVMFLLFSVFFVRPPAAFPVGAAIVIKKGQILKEVARFFEEKQLIRSAFWFTNFVIVRGGEDSVVAGEYFFEKAVGAWGMAGRVTSSKYLQTPVRITIPEGKSAREIAEILKRHLSSFESDRFLTRALPEEGYLFPDTYLFLSTVDEVTVVQTMEGRFYERIVTIGEEIKKFGRPLSEIVIMASFLEEEARLFSTRRKIAGILWKRLRLGMPLQVDAVFPYLLGKNTFEVTTEDLVYDSPYNTYRYRGLPPGPITNPGLESLRAAVTPIETPYLYYLSDREGGMHYAETHDEHVRNKDLYLR